jgi:hypothetical protein
MPAEEGLTGCLGTAARIQENGSGGKGSAEASGSQVFQAFPGRFPAVGCLQIEETGGSSGSGGRQSGSTLLRAERVT